MVNWSLAHSRRIQEGVVRFVDRGRPWVFPHGYAQEDVRQSLRDWQPDGVIAELNDPTYLHYFREFSTPIVNVSNALPATWAPRVGFDDEAIGAMAAEHLLGRGLKDFGFYGRPGLVFSEERLTGYREALRSHGHEPRVQHEELPLDPADAVRWSALEERVVQWLDSLPLGVGVFCANDVTGVQLIEAARRAGRRIPTDLAVLGVDDDDWHARLSKPSLSSVATPSVRVGFAAAALLERLMRGEPAPAEPIRFPPLRVVQRQSTDVVAVADAEVAQAIRFIREHVAEAINVDDVVASVPLSRRSLEYRFGRALGRTPLEELNRVRIERAKELLASTDLPMPAIAERCGLANAERLSVVFKRETGEAPTAFRERCRSTQGEPRSRRT